MLWRCTSALPLALVGITQLFTLCEYSRKFRILVKIFHSVPLLFDLYSMLFLDTVLIRFSTKAAWLVFDSVFEGYYSHTPALCENREGKHSGTVAESQLTRLVG